MATAQEAAIVGTDLLRGIRRELGLSQHAFADLLGCSPRTIQSCEQGWRQPSQAMERLALLLLVSLRWGPELGKFRCWEFTNCPADQREKCPTHQYALGHLCWFLTHTMCAGPKASTWQEKRDICLNCSFLKGLLEDGNGAREGMAPGGNRGVAVGADS